jgi:polyisoprenoid-binding protein YceI
MLLKDDHRRRWPWLLLIVPAVLAVVVSAGTFVYIHFIAPDPAPRLTFPTVATTTSASGAAAGSASTTAGSAAATVDGTWQVSDGSQAGYRVSEVLNGQSNEATGRTTAVTGQLVISGTTVSSATFSVDMAKVASGESQRDSQFRGRIMNTSQYPTATFELTAPIELSSVPANLVEISVKATGTLTLHGTAKAVTIDLTARRNGANLEITGTVPITFSDYGISNPSGGPATVGNAGEMEVLLVLTRA